MYHPGAINIIKNNIPDNNIVGNNIFKIWESYVEDLPKACLKQIIFL